MVPASIQNGPPLRERKTAKKRRFFVKNLQIPVVCLWFAYGFAYGLPMVCPWFAHEFPWFADELPWCAQELPWCAQELPMVCSRNRHGLPINCHGVLKKPHGVPMVFKTPPPPLPSTADIAWGLDHHDNLHAATMTSP